MKHTRTLAALLLLFTGAWAQADYWTNRPNVIRTAENLAHAVVGFDETLHVAGAPAGIIGKAHYLEFAASGLAEDLVEMPYVAALQEVRLIQEDIESVKKDLRRNHGLEANVKVSRAYQVMYQRSRELHLQMYFQIPGPGPDPGVLTLNGAEYFVLGQGSLQSSPTSVAGTGVVLFKNPLKQPDNNYELAFSLEDGGSLKLVANTSDQLTGGAELTFAREGSVLKVKLMQDDLSEEFAGVNAATPIKLSVDIHEHGHVIVWVGDGEEQEYSLQTKLSGLRWGLVLTKASVTTAKDAKAKEDHDDEHEH